MGNLEIKFDIDKLLEVFKERDVIELSITDGGIKLKTYRKSKDK